MKNSVSLRMAVCAIIASISFSLVADETIKIVTWNIEHLGSSGRGFGGGFGGGNIPMRSNAQLADIGEFIENELEADLLAVQEISITHEVNGESRSEQLDKIIAAMGSEWEYYLPPEKEDAGDHQMYVGFIWNSDKVSSLAISPIIVPNIELAGKNLFDRTPVLGYFEIVSSSGEANDFALVNVHLASGQDNDENHLIAMTIIEYRLNGVLKLMKVKESDRIILGDFNDNPHHPTAKRTPAMYVHMEANEFADFVPAGFHATRMDDNLRSTIDRIMVNSSAKRHIIGNKAEIWLPGPVGDTSNYATWRETYSDHFPVYITMKVGSDDDVDW